MYKSIHRNQYNGHVSVGYPGCIHANPQDERSIQNSILKFYVMIRNLKNMELKCSGIFVQNVTKFMFLQFLNNHV
jgi:hypothetical protein